MAKFVLERVLKCLISLTNCMT